MSKRLPSDARRVWVKPHPPAEPRCALEPIPKGEAWTGIVVKAPQNETRPKASAAEPSRA